MVRGGCDICFECVGSRIPYSLGTEGFAHELGHNLGLEHGGNSACNYKPNYPSIMNYRHGYFGVDIGCDDEPDGVLDFSRGARPSLNETALNEAIGTCGGTPINWDGDALVEASVTFDINAYATELAECGAVHTTLTDYDDWNNLQFGSVVGGAGDGPEPRRIMTCYDDPVSIARRKGVATLRR